MKGELGTYDRMTILIWRTMNVLGWSVTALGGAILLRYAFESLPPTGYGELAGGVAPILCGVFIGNLIGSRVVRKPIVVACVVATAFGAITFAWMMKNLIYQFGPVGPSLAYWAFLSVPAALFIARRAARSRPQLSSGREKRN